MNIGDVLVKGFSTGPSVPQKKIKRNVQVESRMTPINFFIVFCFLFTQRYNDIFILPNLFFFLIPVEITVPGLKVFGPWHHNPDPGP